MAAEPDLILIAGVTGRALAQSAARGGHRVVVLDLFADRDTAAASLACRSVVSPHGLRFDRTRLLADAARLAPAAPLVYAAGFEGRLSLLGRLATGRILAGNAADTVRRVREPAQLVPLLQHLGISSPEVRGTLPPDPAGWLAKHPGGAGGTRVRPAARGRWRAGTYFQRYQSGRTLSVLFLADGRRSAIVGWNEQWTSPARPGFPFLYGGAVGRACVPPAVKADIASRIDTLVAATQLRGLNGIDFILDGERWWLLEINPRPTATMELHDPDTDAGLFDAHLRACAGELPAHGPRPGPARASTIVHAPVHLVVPDELPLPDWCRDLPQSGLQIAAGDPVCTVHAEGTSAAEARAAVHARRAELEARLAAQMAEALPV
jgi:predicted ATP-grasp superfamily ATP-dependent carboligase